LRGAVAGVPADAVQRKPARSSAAGLLPRHFLAYPEALSRRSPKVSTGVVVAVVAVAVVLVVLIVAISMRGRQRRKEQQRRDLRVEADQRVNRAERAADIAREEADRKTDLDR
jgi:flagellar biosynthesis/type III secretory pathway M-ring protein FliF/YscJ